jgi:hypothetical protein
MNKTRMKNPFREYINPFPNANSKCHCVAKRGIRYGVRGFSVVHPIQQTSVVSS